MGRRKCQTASSTPQQRNLWGVDRWQRLFPPCWLLTLVRNRKKILLLLCGALRRTTTEEILRQLQLQLLPVRSSQIEKITGACGKVKRQHMDGKWRHFQRGMSRKWDQSIEVIRQATKDGKSVHFANWMDLCHMKNAECAKHFQKCNQRVVLRGDNVKDEEGYRAVVHRARCINVSFGSRKRLWTLSQSFRGMAGETSDAIPAYTQVQMTEAPTMLRLVTRWNQAGDKLFAKIDQLSNQKLYLFRNLWLCWKD